MKIDLLSIILYDHLPIGNGQVYGHTLRPYCKPVSCFSEIERSQKNTVKNEKLAFSSVIWFSFSRALLALPPLRGACREYWNIAYRWPRAVHAHATQHHTNVLIAQPSNNAITTVRRTLLFDAPAFVELCSMHSSSWSCPLHLTSPFATAVAIALTAIVTASNW